jgi:enamine deaminase RidA (YjgF/YER057c/UK114 family)
MAELKTLYEVYPKTKLALMPLGVRVNDMVYANGIAGVDPATGQFAPDLISQMKLALEHMQTLIEGAGASLDNIARGVAYVTSTEDRDAADGPWVELFGDAPDRPAFKILITKLPPGQLVRLDVLALVGQKRQRIDLPNINAHDPTIKIGNWVFSSRLHGADPATGRMVEGGAEEQATQLYKNMASLAEQAGARKENIVQVNTFGNDEAYMAPSRKAFQAAFPQKPAYHPLISFIRANNALMAEMAATTSRDEVFEELYLAPEKNNVAAGAKVGPVIFAADLTGIDPATSQLVGSDTESQLRHAIKNMDTLLAAAGSHRGELARVNFFMANMRDKDPVLNPVWEGEFPNPDDRPPHSYIPGKLPEGYQVSVQVLAVRGASRRSLYVEGVQHGDPMTLGALTGNLVTSSRIFGGGQDPMEHTRLMFGTASNLLQQVGGNLGDLQQALIYISKPEYQEAVETRWREGNGGKDVRFNYVETDLGRGNLLPRLQMIAIV